MSRRDAYDKYHERIDAHVASAPPLSPEQIACLAVLFNTDSRLCEEATAGTETPCDSSLNGTDTEQVA